MYKIIENFKMEKCYEDDNKIYYRRMYGYKENRFLWMNTLHHERTSQILLFAFDKNKEYDSIQRTICFKPLKGLLDKMFFIKIYRKHLDCSLKDIINIEKSGKLVLDNELEYEFMKVFLLNIGYDVI